MPALEAAATPSADAPVVADTAAVVAPAVVADPATPAAAAPAVVADPAAQPAAKVEADAAIEYTDFTLPEGATRDAEILGEFAETAKALKLSQEDAQKLVSIGAKSAQKGMATLQQALTKAADDWTNAAKVDPEFGGEKFDENIAQARNVFDTFGTPELGKLLDESRIGSHPEILRWALNVSKAISTDKIVTGRQSGATRDAASVLYDAPARQV